MRSSQTRAGPKSNDKCLQKSRDRRKTAEPCDNGDRDQTNVSTGQWTVRTVGHHRPRSEARDRQLPPESFQKGPAMQHLDSGLVAPRPGRV